MQAVINTVRTFEQFFKSFQRSIHDGFVVCFQSGVKYTVDQKTFLQGHGPKTHSLLFRKIESDFVSFGCIHFIRECITDDHPEFIGGISLCFCKNMVDLCLFVKINTIEQRALYRSFIFGNDLCSVVGREFKMRKFFFEFLKQVIIDSILFNRQKGKRVVHDK